MATNLPTGWPSSDALRLTLIRLLASFGVPIPDSDPMKPPRKPTSEQKARMCTGKRRYASEGLALQAAQVAGVERWRKAYLCAACGKWHLTSK